MIISMNIDIESIGLLSLILQDSPKDRQLILCILARSNSVPTRITFSPNTEYPTFYGYTNSRIPFYLMGTGVISNVPREGYAKRLLSSYYLSYAETIINRGGKRDFHQKLTSVSKFITLDNKTTYKDAEVFLIFRDRALGYIKDYAVSHRDEIASFLGQDFIKAAHLETFLTQADYSDKASRKGLEKKWDALQAIWTVFVSNNRPEKMLISIRNLAIKDRSVHEIDGIFEGLSKDGCFIKWHRGTENYAVEGINPDTLESIYKQTKSVYEEPDKTQTQPSDAPKKLSKRDLKKIINGVLKTRKFGKKEKAFLKFLSDFEPHTIEAISSEISTKDCKHLKGRVDKKLKGTGFSIKTLKATGWGNKSHYQLEYLPTPATS